MLQSPAAYGRPAELPLRGALRLFELLAFAFGFRLDFFCVMIEANEDTPRPQEDAHRGEQARGVGQLRQIFIQCLERR